MNLKNLLFIGHNLTKANFEIIKEQAGSGYFHYSVEPVETGYLAEKKEEKTAERQFILDIKSKVEGFEKDTEENVFNLDIEFSLCFSIENDFDVEKEFSEEGDWFLKNFAAVSAKDIIESIIKHTPMKGLMVPAHRAFEEDPQ